MTNEPDSTNSYGNKPQLPTESNSWSELPKKRDYYHLEKGKIYKSAKMINLTLKINLYSEKCRGVGEYLKHKSKANDTHEKTIFGYSLPDIDLIWLSSIKFIKYLKLDT